MIIPPNTAFVLSGISEYGYFILLDLVPVFVEDLACFLFVIVLRSIPSACLVPSVSVTGTFPSDLP